MTKRQFIDSKCGYKKFCEDVNTYDIQVCYNGYTERSITFLGNKSYIIKHPIKEMFEIKRIIKKIPTDNLVHLDGTDVFYYTALVKIKSVVDTNNNLNRFSNRRTGMFELNQLFKIVDVYPDYILSNGEVKDFVSLVDPITNNKYKFLFSDIEIIYPPILKLLTYKKFDRTIKKGMIAKVIRKKNKINIPYGARVLVNAFKKVGNQDYCHITYNSQNYNIRKRCLTIVDGDNKNTKEEKVIEKSQEEQFSREMYERLSREVQRLQAYGSFTTSDPSWTTITTGGAQWNTSVRFPDHNTES